MMKSVSPSTVVDRAVALLSQRLKSYRVKASVVRKTPLSETMVDPEQLKEVIVNIMINACEAMRDGGSIVIEEKEHLASEHESFDIKFGGKMGPMIAWILFVLQTMERESHRRSKSGSLIPFSPQRMKGPVWGSVLRLTSSMSMAGGWIW